jgi:sucrose phosphorylase
VYYVGLLAGSNDMQLLSRTRVGRDINRHYYTRSEIEHAIERPVVADLLRLIRLRNSHPAFNGAFTMGPAPDEALDLHWQNGPDFASLRVDLRSCAYRLEYSRGGSRESFVFSAAAEADA